MVEMIDTTEFILYSQTKKGNFEEFRTEEQNRFTFTHIYPERDKDSLMEKFEENWIEKINNNGR